MKSILMVSCAFPMLLAAMSFGNVSRADCSDCACDEVEDDCLTYACTKALWDSNREPVLRTAICWDNNPPTLHQVIVYLTTCEYIVQQCPNYPNQVQLNLMVSCYGDPIWPQGVSCENWSWAYVQQCTSDGC